MSRPQKIQDADMDFSLRNSSNMDNSNNYGGFKAINQTVSMGSDAGSFLTSRMDDSSLSSGNANNFKGLKNRKKNYTDETEY